MRQWNLATIMLAPFVLSTRKPLESDCFIDLYTKIDVDPSENKVYLLYKYDGSSSSRCKLNKVLFTFIKEPCYLYYNIFHKDKKCYYLFAFKADRIDELKKNITFYTIDDKFKVCCFWGDRIKEFKNLIHEYIKYSIKQKTLITKCE